MLSPGLVGAARPGHCDQQPRAACRGSPACMTTASPPPTPLVVTGITCVGAGFGATQPVALAVGCGLLAAAGLAAAGNLSVTPVLLPRNSSRPAAPVCTEARAFDQRSAAAPRGGSVTLSVTAIAVATVAAIMAAAALGLGQPGPGTRTSRCCPVITNGQSRLLTVQLGDMFVRPVVGVGALRDQGYRVCPVGRGCRCVTAARKRQALAGTIPVSPGRAAQPRGCHVSESGYGAHSPVTGSRCAGPR